MTQSAGFGPVHVWQADEQGVHDEPLLKLPSGHTVPEDVTDGGGLHLVWSLASWENPGLQMVQTPVDEAHCVHPS